MCFEEIVLALTCLEWRCGRWTLNRRFQVLCSKSSARELPHVTIHREAGFSSNSGCRHSRVPLLTSSRPAAIGRKWSLLSFTTIFSIGAVSTSCPPRSCVSVSVESERISNERRFCRPSLAARAAWATSTRGASSRVSASVPFLPSRPRTSRSAAPRRSGGASPVFSRSWLPSAS